MSDFLREYYREKRVLITGHTGFKGSWLTLWLSSLGAIVTGYSLTSNHLSSLFSSLNLENDMIHLEGDIRDAQKIRHIIEEQKPDIIFHMAAQSLVFDGYQFPRETFDTNVMGTVNLLEAVRSVQLNCTVVVVTSDKCYDNKEWLFGYRECDRLGGHDPYSSSKACAELVAHSYRSSFFRENRKVYLATARSGNVIGGGDFSKYRILPDVIRALIKDEKILLRAPLSVRPWMYVLDSLYGYLRLAYLLSSGKARYSEPFNFGPLERKMVSTKELVDKVIASWGYGEYETMANSSHPHEMSYLKLNWDKAKEYLDWEPKYTWEQAVEETVHWFHAYHKGCDIKQLSLNQIAKYSTSEFCCAF